MPKIATIMAVLLLAIIMIFISILMWTSQPISESMKENYEVRKKEIIDLKHYFESITDGGKTKVYIEFKWSGVEKLCANGDCFESSDSTEDTLYKINSELGWNDTTISILRKKLKTANCISINNFLKDGLLEIGFKRKGLGMYSYTVFNNNPTEKEIKNFSNGCNSAYYKDNIALRYDGASFGPQCFENYKKSEN